MSVGMLAVSSRSPVLTHQTAKSLEGSRNPNAGIHLDKDALGRVDVHLEQAAFIQRRIEQGEKALIYQPFVPLTRET
jgi:hypothetical protein